MKRQLLVSASAALGASATRLDAREPVQAGGTCCTRLRVAAVILSLIPGLAACGSERAYQGIESAHRTEAAQTWPRLVLTAARNDAPGYSVQVPLWLIRRGVDARGSDRAQFEGEGIRLKFEFGPGAEIPSCGRRPCAQIETIDGRRATFIEVDLSSDRPTLFRRRAWALVEAGGGAKLATDALCADAQACERARQIVRTVRFGNYAVASPAPPIPADEPSWPYLRGPSADEAYCRRADPKDARRFRHLQLMAAFRDVRVYGRPGHMMCTTASSKVGQCKITGWSEVRVETSTDVSGFWNNGNVPVLLTFRGERSSCRRLSALD